ncbi:hypothetical protein Pcinc_014435 [Petrolisthes cinctipes]|uniref:Uncharacterized protein n=1 Tax=Petrolisthes cinctipes TaxID=88211 RepID=A0AAE1KRS4_PETCI|nr:hypothetical protein Pcinc_014435 [Petrolisthes cinctipes]
MSRGFHSAKDGRTDCHQYHQHSTTQDFTTAALHVIGSTLRLFRPSPPKRSIPQPSTTRVWAARRVLVHEAQSEKGGVRGWSSALEPPLLLHLRQSSIQSTRQPVTSDLKFGRIFARVKRVQRHDLLIQEGGFLRPLPPLGHGWLSRQIEQCVAGQKTGETWPRGDNVATSGRMTETTCCPRKC